MPSLVVVERRWSENPLTRQLPCVWGVPPHLEPLSAVVERPLPLQQQCFRVVCAVRLAWVTRPGCLRLVRAPRSFFEMVAAREREKERWRAVPADPPSRVGSGSSE
mmetsp:Transcript_2347/g.6778  ORF Transcript_2347/g.6778 Transcript_2347/m.6778 type:complete len:106 (-) Transcript_2347:396-713(-)